MARPAPEPPAPWRDCPACEWRHYPRLEGDGFRSVQTYPESCERCDEPLGAEAPPVGTDLR